MNKKIRSLILISSLADLAYWKREIIIQYLENRHRDWKNVEHSLIDWSNALEKVISNSEELARQLDNSSELIDIISENISHYIDDVNSLKK
ncbi:hypothetical protein LB941_05285 [Ligilactobacillus sp. WILCCON 0076]|uniref:Uncharacterized protein n=1 Tax=Ligilactobacillus ubinensis TaxID=2876789 RepID=A0A9X2FJA0_9LACO|nr:hypothetical protein [Ligilactobacillus ubinensis]MCP0886751.1 hypothetical protein [Ligilactobacillus ubinensis]